MTQRFYVECTNHHVGYYSIMDRLTGDKTQGDILEEFGQYPIEKSNEFGYRKEAEPICDRMNAHERYLTDYLDGMTAEDFIQEPFHLPPDQI